MKQLMAGLGLILLAIILEPGLEGLMTGAVKSEYRKFRTETSVNLG